MYIIYNTRTIFRIFFSCLFSIEIFFYFLYTRIVKKCQRYYITRAQCKVIVYKINTKTLGGGEIGATNKYITALDIQHTHYSTRFETLMLVKRIFFFYIYIIYGIIVIIIIRGKYFVSSRYIHVTTTTTICVNDFFFPRTAGVFFSSLTRCGVPDCELIIYIYIIRGDDRDGKK